MVLCDVNVLLYACTSQSAHHRLCREVVLKLGANGEPFAFSELILAAVVRLATNPRIFDPPASPESAFAFANAIREHPQGIAVAPGTRHWRLFMDLVLSTGIRGGDTTDAYLAAIAMEHGCEWWTTDSDFDRFPGLRRRNLLSAGIH